VVLWLILGKKTIGLEREKEKLILGGLISRVDGGYIR
jgi:hypothetical protein